MNDTGPGRSAPPRAAPSWCLTSLAHTARACVRVVASSAARASAESNALVREVEGFTAFLERQQPTSTEA
jgi:hypothetical protein